MVKFTSPQEFYDWYDANRTEIKSFKEQYDESIRPWSQSSFLNNKLTWTRITAHERVIFKQIQQKLLKEDELYIVTNASNWHNRKTKWWIIYIPIPLYKQSANISDPFAKEAWWYSKENDIQESSLPSDLSWIVGFIHYTPLITMLQSLNYPRGL